MIFVTVGTHEQAFNRLVEGIDELKHDGTIDEEVVVQTGYSTYRPKYCESKDFFTYQEMVEYVREAHIVITHGGPSSFIMPLQIGKVPIVIPRQKKFGEHVNDHQVIFTAQVEKRNKNIIRVVDIENLKNAIINYDSLASRVSDVNKSNNEKFNAKLSEIVEQLFD